MKTKVLIFVSWFEPGFKAGGPITSNVNIVNNLADKFDFFVITSSHDYHADKPYEGIEENKWVDRGCAKVMYLAPEHSGFSELKAAAKAAACDVWYVNGIYDPTYSIMPLVLSKLLKPKKVIISARGMLSPQAFGTKVWLKNLLIRLFRYSLYKRTIFHATNTEEAGFIKQKLGNSVEVFVAENLPRKFDEHEIEYTKRPKSLKLVSFARISSEKNTLFAIQALAKCKENITYDIYGQINGDDYWSECRQAIDALPSNVHVEYKGAVAPSQLASLYQKYDMMYLPTTGENFGHAIMESFLNGRPVIISDRTPWLELEAKGVGWSLPLDMGIFTKIIDMAASLSTDEYMQMSAKVTRFVACYLEKEGKGAVDKHVKMLSI